MILAIDPGTNISGWVLFDPSAMRVLDCGIYENHVMLKAIRDTRAHLLAIEMVAAMGMPVGKEVFETVRWIGRFQQIWGEPEKVRFVYRREVKIMLCGSMRAKDPHIRQALIDKLGPVGTAKKQGPLYHVRSHAWQALGVAIVAVQDAMSSPIKPRTAQHE